MLNPQNTEIAIPDPMLDVALKYNKIGIPVFPCRAGEEESVDPKTGELFTLGAKGPLTVNGFHSATLMPRIIGEFWKRNPGALIGIPTGEKLGAWVLDIDMHRDENGETIDGFAALSALEAKYGALPKTATVRTAGGGEHRYFAHVSGVRNRGALGAGLDVRGDGGYVIAAESVLSDGRAYRWVDHDGDGLPDIAEAPEWLLQLILPRSYDSSYASHQSVEGKFSDRYVERAIDLELSETASTPMGGGRNNRLNQAAFSLGTFVGAGALSESEARALLQDVARGWGRDFPVSGAKGDKAARVQDALAKAMAVGKLSGDNLNTVIESGGRVAEALAESLGTTVSGLRGLGAQGKITGNDIVKGLSGQLEKLRREAESMPASRRGKPRLFYEVDMKIYTVMQAPYTVSKDEGATIFMGAYFDPEVFDDEDDAVESAQRLARQHRGTQVWIVEGEALRSFQCEPLLVVEAVPSIQVGA